MIVELKLLNGNPVHVNTDLVGAVYANENSNAVAISIGSGNDIDVRGDLNTVLFKLGWIKELPA